jgi:hypothetical protein
MSKSYILLMIVVAARYNVRKYADSDPARDVELF